MHLQEGIIGAGDKVEGGNSGHKEVILYGSILSERNSLECATDYPKTGGQTEKRRQPERAGGAAGSVACTDAGSSASSSHSSDSSTGETVGVAGS